MTNQALSPADMQKILEDIEYASDAWSKASSISLAVRRGEILRDVLMARHSDLLLYIRDLEAAIKIAGKALGLIYGASEENPSWEGETAESALAKISQYLP